MNITLIGIDVAKNIFQLCCVNRMGKIIQKKRLSRDKLLSFIAQTPKCCIVMEACGSANYWAREFEKLAHEVKLISPQFVKPFVMGNKNDYRDAEAIVEAASRPQMRYVTPKTAEQQNTQSVLRVREGSIVMRTKISNQVRGLLAEYGQVIPRGMSQLKRALPRLFDRQVENGLSKIMKELLETQYHLLLTIDKNIGDCDTTLKEITKNDERCQRLMEVEGIGMITAVALVTLVGNGAGFKNGRHFSAFVGLVPRQHSSGNTQKLLGISKRGDEYVRRMLIHGARSVVIRSGNKTDQRNLWIHRLKVERGVNKATVALANKNARIAMALLLTGEHYRKSA